MAAIRCPKCGKNNPDILDVCQFCQAPLKPDSMLHIGETPTKKDTGELEAVLPDWLKDVRKQARASAEEETAQAASQPKVEKDRAPDFLAGLASQAGNTGDEEIPDWLASINPVAGSTKSAPPFVSEPEPAESDFFAQFSQKEVKPVGEPPQKQVPSAPEPAAERVPASSEEDDLSKWFARAAEQPEEIVQIEPEAGRQDEGAWAGTFEAPMPPQQPPTPKEEEDLGWLRNLEDAAKQTGDLQAPKQGTDWVASFEMPSTSSEPSRPQEDLSWLNDLGSVAESTQQALAQPSAAGEDLRWLDNLSAVTAPQAFDATPDQPVSAPPFTSTSGEDLSWLNDLGMSSEQQSTPPFVETGSLGKQEEAQPDWLKSAVETPSTPTAGDTSMDWFTGQEEPAQQQPTPPAGTTPAAPQPAPFADLFSTPNEPAPSALSSQDQDVDSLFSVEMPDWLSRSEPVAAEPPPQEAALPPAGTEESLAPVDLPSWVQAMRPVEAVISETASGAAEEPEEKEGPLAGLRGVIPGAAIGLSKKPKAVSLKLQATNEQQASATLLEKILESETNPRALITSSLIASQRALRWALTALFVLMLGIVIGLQPHMMQVDPNLTEGGKAADNAVASLPASAKVLVVIDYEPSLAGEMEAIGGPLLDQLTVQHNPEFSFLSTTPNGPALVERLLAKTGLSKLAVQYHNLGFLPGGSTGVLGFMEQPERIIPASKIGKFSDYSVLVLMTDHAESGRTWVEQLYAQKQRDLALTNQPFIVVASAQAGPLLQPYFSSGQITGMISGLSEAARYENKNVNRPGIARSYLDAFGVGLMMSIVLIVIGSLWSMVTGIRARRAEAEQG